MLGQKETLVVAAAAVIASWISTGIANTTKDASIKFNSTLWSWGLSGGAGMFLALVFFKGASMVQIGERWRTLIIIAMMSSIIVPPILMSLVYGSNGNSIRNYWDARIKEAKVGFESNTLGFHGFCDRIYSIFNHSGCCSFVYGHS